MKTKRTLILSLATTTLAAIMMAATTAPLQATTPLWMRDVQISPDGSTIAFCYKGDIYTVPSTGGAATRLTSLDSYEQTPIWSPDGSSIAFSSDRYGNFDIFTMSSKGGSATRLTFNSAAETPLCFTPDGTQILLSANIQAPAQSLQFPRAALGQVYKVGVTAGKVVQVLGTPAHAACYSPDGAFFVYQDSKGMENTWRKHHISSVTRDIWMYDCSSGRHTNLTNRPGEDLNPVLDGRTIYCLSEPADGDGHPKKEGWTTSLNVWSFSLDDPAEMKQLSFFDTHPVRFLSIGGGTLCYSWNGEIYTQVPGKDPRKVAIDITLDEENTPIINTVSSGATEAAVSADGKQVALIIRGDVFVTSADYRTTRRITDTPCAESGVEFAPDGRSIVYASDRGGLRQLYTARIVRKEDPDFANATLIEEKPFLHEEGVERSCPKYSADGKKIAFIQNRTSLVVSDVKGGKATTVTDGSEWFDLGDGFNYDWSRDGKWFTLEFVPNGHDPYYNIGIVSAEGGPVVDITGSGYMSAHPRFTFDGNAVMFSSDRYGMRSHASWGSQDDVFLCFLNQEAYDRFRLTKEDLELQKAARKKDTVKNKKISVELEGIEDRIVRLTPNSSSLSGAILSKDGESLYYLARFEKGYDLWKMDIRKKETKLLSKDAGGGNFIYDSNGKIYLVGRSVKALEGDKLKGIDYSAKLTVDPYAERKYMFDYVRTEEARRFYCEDMHGVDWNKYCDAYERFLPHISNNYDFSELLSELLGELNVSHTGSGYRANLKTERTACLGVLYDLSYRGEGLKVAEVLQAGPLDKASLNVEAGDIITSIDGKKISGTEDPGILLGGRAGIKTLLGIKGKKDIVVVPFSAGEESDLLYKRWVRRCAEKVEELSGGRLGYVHIQSMNDGSFRTIYNDIMGKYYKCDGIVIDQRYNGGGRLHEDIEVLFGGKKYLTQVVRGREACDMPSRRCNKPSIMLQCECDYSNAHGTPWVYSHCGLGKLVGAPVPGTMTSVNWVTLQDESLYFGIPVIGYRTAEGNYLENTQLDPDILVYNTPEDLSAGKDAQLEAAVRELLAQIDAQKAK